MEKQNVGIHQKELARIIALEISILHEMGAMQNFLAESGTFIKNSIKKEQENLSDEKSKLERLEIVIAVVGTMKAGKSTTINAIVGTQVLPNRNTPMTSLPTLIRHVESRNVSALKFAKTAPIEKLVSRLKRKNIEISVFANKHEGAEEIFEFLTAFNDLVREANNNDEEFPIEEYSSLEDLPVIETKFSSIVLSNDRATLTLLDTPGQNEQGMPYLRDVVKGQLKKSSAIILILDYTQLKSQAEAELREQVKEFVRGESKELTYVLINKVDQRDANSMDEETIRGYVADSLFENIIPLDRIFPVSSQKGYLSNRAKTCIDTCGILPDGKHEPWVKDFAKIAFGVDYDNEDIADMEKVRKKAVRIWEQSGLDEPLEKIIRMAHSRAADFAMVSAFAKANEMKSRLHDYCKNKLEGLSTENDTLRSQIKKLLQNTGKLEGLESDTNNRINNLFQGMTDEFKQILETLNKEIEEVVSGYFKYGKSLQKADENKASNDKGILKKFAKWLRESNSEKGKQNAHTDKDFDPDGVFEFYARNDAQKMRSKIEKSLQTIVQTADEYIKNSIDEKVKNLSGQFLSSIVSKAKETLDDVQKGLEKNDFQLKYELPNINPVSVNWDKVSDLVNISEDKAKKLRRQVGLWGTVCGWFNTDDWGWESYDEKVYKIDIAKIRNEALKNFENMFGELGKIIVQDIESPFRNCINEFLDNLSKRVRALTSDFENSLKDKEKSENDLQQIKLNCEGLLLKIEGFSADLGDLNDEWKVPVNA